MVCDAGSLFFHHLFSFSTIRKEHDRVYHAHFASRELRARVEGLAAPDRLKLPGGGYDPAMRQHDVSGARIIRLREGEPEAEYLRNMDLLLSARFHEAGRSILEAIDDALVAEPPLAPSASHAELRVLLDPTGAVDEAVTLGIKLGLLVLKRRKLEPSLTCAALWEMIRQHTDELYVVAEKLMPAFNAALLMLVRASPRVERAARIVRTLHRRTAASHAAH